MSQDTQQTSTVRREPLPPLVSAADVTEANYPRAWFDTSIADTIKHVAQQRAPTRDSVWSHRVGFAGELGASTYFGAEPDWTIHPGFVGDDGFDFLVGDHRVEVKTITRREDIELWVPQEKVDSADYFVLAQCWNPSEMAQLVGSISRPRLQRYGHRFDGDVRVGPEYLSPLEPLHLEPDQIREIQR